MVKFEYNFTLEELDCLREGMRRFRKNDLPYYENGKYQYDYDHEIIAKLEDIFEGLYYKNLPPDER